MMKCGDVSKATASKPRNEIADTINSSSIDSTTTDMLTNENLSCQSFSIRGYVAEKRNTNPAICIPFNGISENTWQQLRGSLDVPHFKRWRCRSCVREPVNSSSTVQDSSLELSVARGFLEKNEAINMVDIIGEREIPCIVSLELLAVAAKMASDHPQLEPSQTSNAEKDSSTPKKANSAGTPKKANSAGTLERKTAGFGTDTTGGESDKASIVFTDIIDSEDERKLRKTRLLKDLIRAEEKNSSGKGVRTHTVQRIEEKPFSSSEKDIYSEGEGQEFIRSQGSRKSKRSCPFLPDTDLISSKHAQTTGSFSKPLLSRNRRTSNDRK